MIIYSKVLPWSVDDICRNSVDGIYMVQVINFMQSPSEGLTKFKCVLFFILKTTVRQEI